MNVRFIASDPRQKSKPVLDSVLSSGTDQIAICCAFLTEGGVELLMRHAERLRLPDSFIVVAWEPPTNLAALTKLHGLIPGNLYLHLGAKTPVEKGVGRGLMHSKVFFARAGGRCSLWTGSHNLTASASQGVNCEAAVLLEGTTDEEQFGEALAHLNKCKQEAVVFDPSNPPPLRSAQQTLVIHAECSEGLKSCPWFVHLRPASTDYDMAMRPPAAVWLYLYSPGSLRPGSPRPPALTAYSGTLTALNFTEIHPRHRGISADWRTADYVIEQENGILNLTKPRPHTRAPSQGVFRVEGRQDPRTVWLCESPAPTLERVVGDTWFGEVEPEFRPFFTRQSLHGMRLIHNLYRRLKRVYRVPRKEVGQLQPPALIERLGMPENTEVEIAEMSDDDDKFAFIYRAKYRL